MQEQQINSIDSLLGGIKQTKFEENSTDIVSGIYGIIDNIAVKDKGSKRTVFINILATDGRRFLDTVTFDTSNPESARKSVGYFSAHVKDLLEQLDIEQYLTGYKDTLEALQKIKQEKRQFKFSTTGEQYSGKTYVKVSLE